MRRRGVVGAIAVAAVAAAAGGAAWRFRLFGPRYQPTPYDDLLNQITDRAPASLFGKEALATMPGIDAPDLARMLRAEAGLAALAESDPVRGRVREVAGWVVPESVARYAALAAAV
jgi:hypothetical protein